MARQADILVVDDTPANLDLLTTLLEDAGYHVRPAINGQLALKAATNPQPDLILLDIMMPDMSGFEVAARLKENEETAGIPIIFISALNDTDDIVRAFDLGGVDYVTKPFRRREVLARIENHLALVRQREQIEKYYQSLDALKTQFMQSATHDLKNPLTLISGYVDILEVSTMDEIAENRAMYTYHMRTGLRRMKILITDMLDLAQIETGLELYIEPVLIGWLLEQARQTYEMMAKERQITVIMEEPGYEMLAHVDSSRMLRVLENLVSNAIKYTPEGGTVTIGCIREDQVDRIWIKDTGLGIPEDDIEKIFEAFFRVAKKEHRMVEGTGLGLSIVDAIIKQHGGEVQVDSVVGEGSTFTILLPRTLSK
ncbi:MAG: hybrid sensor histidine kinase/response regulator [Chloroflexi bacterium]|nr:hybrid sensor histidine kinase/response regulator [Chloroflexota bacterium]